tara:strand:- start:1753 stop:1923 length:171 start_codon:yes stop_codon:yes gene_type:complete
LQSNAKYSWLAENGRLVILNNGIEFAATYTVILVEPLYMGAGKISIDHLIAKRFQN